MVHRESSTGGGRDWITPGPDIGDRHPVRLPGGVQFAAIGVMDLEGRLLTVASRYDLR